MLPAPLRGHRVSLIFIIAHMQRLFLRACHQSFIVIQLVFALALSGNVVFCSFGQIAYFPVTEIFFGGFTGNSSAIGILD